MLLTKEEYLAHYGTLHKSGRYPWGSGGDPTGKRSKTFLDMTADLRRQGLTETEIARGLGISRNTLQARKSSARNEYQQAKIRRAQRLRDEGKSLNAIAKLMDLPGDSSVRALLAPGAANKANTLKSTSDMLRREVDKKGAVDIGTDVYRSISLNDNPSAQIGISSTTFDTAVAKLVDEGYKYHLVNVPSLGMPGKFTRHKALSRPEVTWKSLVDNPSLIKPITEYSPDAGHAFDGIKPPLNVSSKRVKVVYGNEGGKEADGLIYLRPGVKDLSMGKANYSQVRIAIDGSHYLKGMAVYKDDLPAGTDLVFNTNKGNTGNKHDAMKKMSDDPDLPFSAVIKPGSQIKDLQGNVISAINKVNEEGDWDTWSKNLPSQFLSKQSPKLAQTQLDRTFERRRKEFDEITALTNPAVRKKLLETFADETDSAAVHLKAASMPSQTTKVLIPIKSIKEGEVFCPSLTDGTRVALVRFPHGGTFEIPQVTVNNKNREARKILGSSNPDALGIHFKVAERLSGADFDGDYVLAIPNMRGDVKSTPALEGLKNFDPKAAYKAYHGMKTVDGGTWNEHTKTVEYPIDPKTGKEKKPNTSNMQHQMGDVSNLIADMTIKGATADELARAVRHSMVVIDCEKHVLDYKSSSKDNAILALKREYQAQPDGKSGASTIISRAKSDYRIPNRKPRPAAEGGPIDKATGKLVFVPTGESYVDKKTGKTVTNVTKYNKLAVVEDARTLVSQPMGTPVEHIYAEHSNRLKAMANEARKEYISTEPIRMSESAKQVYSKEVASLNSQLNVARQNRPRERQAQAIANAEVAQKKAANPHLDRKDVKKIQNQALAEARVRCGARKTPIVITDREWEAIQSGAISNNMLKKILDDTNINDVDGQPGVRSRATPHAKPKMSASFISRAKVMLDSGYTQAEVAEQLGVGLTTLKDSLESGA